MRNKLGSICNKYLNVVTLNILMSRTGFSGTSLGRRVTEYTVLHADTPTLQCTLSLEVTQYNTRSTQ